MVDSPIPKIRSKKGRLPRIVGQFIREKREQLGISQRALGQRFTPSVTTQFISNVERGITPLPPTHVQTLAQALQVSEEEFRKVLEKEYAQRLSGRLGNEDLELSSKKFSAFFEKLEKALESANPETRRRVLLACEQTLGTSLGPIDDSTDSSSSRTPI